MHQYIETVIPDWLYKEVEEYFTPLPFVPRTILDIGANVGAFALRANQKWPAAKIYCFEPMPYNVMHLRRNVPVGTDVTSAAIRAESGLDNIYIGDKPVTGGFVKGDRQTKNQLLVECISAKELPCCDLVKIDTEGSEVEIIECLKLDSVKAIFLEYHSLDDANKLPGILKKQFNLTSKKEDGSMGILCFVSKTI